MQDILRFFLALSVVFFHVKHFAQQTALTSIPEDFQPPLFWLLEPIYTYGYHAVTVFFFLSGFMLASHITSEKFDHVRFMRKRLARIYPAHLISLIYMALLSLTVASTTNLNLFITYNDNITNFLASFFLLNGLGLTKDFSFNLPSWSLSVELLCYIVFAILVSTCRSHLTKIFGALIVLGGSISAVNAGPMIGNVGNGLTFFFGGAVFALVFTKRANLAKQASTWILFFLILGSLVSFVLSINIPLGPQKFIWIFFTLPLATAAIYYIDTYIEKKTNSARPFKYLGLMSFSIYIWHFPVQASMFYLIVILDVELTSWYNNWLTLVVYIAVSMLVAHISLKTIEKTGSNYISPRHSRTL